MDVYGHCFRTTAVDAVVCFRAVPCMFIFQVCSHTTSREHLMDGRLRALLQNHSSECCCVFKESGVHLRSYSKSAPTPPHESTHDDALVAHAVCGSGWGILSRTCTAAVVTAFHAAAESASQLVMAVGLANGQVCARVLTSTPPLSP